MALWLRAEHSTPEDRPRVRSPPRPHLKSPGPSGHVTAKVVGKILGRQSGGRQLTPHLNQTSRCRSALRDVGVSQTDPLTLAQRPGSGDGRASISKVFVAIFVGVFLTFITRKVLSC